MTNVHEYNNKRTTAGNNVTFATRHEISWKFRRTILHAIRKVTRKLGLQGFIEGGIYVVNTDMYDHNEKCYEWVYGGDYMGLYAPAYKRVIINLKPSIFSGMSWEQQIKSICHTIAHELRHAYQQLTEMFGALQPFNYKDAVQQYGRAEAYKLWAKYPKEMDAENFAHYADRSFLSKLAIY